MNYILHFQSRDLNHLISQSAIKEFFQHRENYSVNDYQVLYSNEETGVYFTFQFGGGHGPDAASSGVLPVYFSLEYSRSHIFILEAETELSDFIQNFNLSVSDLYLKNAEYVAYNQVDLFRGWTAGSETYYQGIERNRLAADYPSLPTKLLEQCWHWNYHLKHLQGELGKEIFIPRVMVVEYQGKLHTAVVWTDAGPIALPRVELVILYRKTGSWLKKHGDMGLARVSDIEPLLSGFSLDEDFFPYYTLIYKEPPAQIKHFFQAQSPVSSQEIKFISFDQVHDREMIEKVLSQPQSS